MKMKDENRDARKAIRFYFVCVYVYMYIHRIDFWFKICLRINLKIIFLIK
jgi:hypothetical protein